jgi:hypothetical protein
MVHMIWGYEMNRWADNLYERLRPMMTPEELHSAESLKIEEYNEFAADMLSYGIKQGMITLDELEKARRSVEAGAGRSFKLVKAGFLQDIDEAIAALKNAPAKAA